METEQQVRYTTDPSGLDRLEQFLKVVPPALGTIAAVFLIVAGIITFLIASIIGDIWQSLRVGLMITGALSVGVLWIVSGRQREAKYQRREAQHQQDIKDIAIAMGTAIGGAVAESAKHTLVEAKYRQLPEPTPPLQLPPPPVATTATWKIDGTESPRNMPTTVLDESRNEVRVDLLDALITIGFGPNPIADMREAVRAAFPNLHFRSGSLTLAFGWLRENDVISESGEWLMDEDEARGTVADARAARPLPSPISRQV